MIRKLNVAVSDRYSILKKKAMYELPWTYVPATCNPDETNDHQDIPQFVHTIIARPYGDNPYPAVVDNKNHMLATNVVRDILRANGVKMGCIFRLSINMLVTVDPNNSWGARHVDHGFPHKNLLIYFNKPKTGGNLRVWENTYRVNEPRPIWGEYEEYQIEEDGAVMFDGWNYHQGQGPTTFNDRRVFMIATFTEDQYAYAT